MIPCIFLHQAPRCRIIQHSYLSHGSCHPHAECNSIQRNHLLPTKSASTRKVESPDLTWYNSRETKLRKSTSIFFLHNRKNQGLEAQTSVFLQQLTPLQYQRSKQEKNINGALGGGSAVAKVSHIIFAPFQHRFDTPSIHPYQNSRAGPLRRHGYHVPLTHSLTQPTNPLCLVLRCVRRVESQRGWNDALLMLLRYTSTAQMRCTSCTETRNVVQGRRGEVRRRKYSNEAR